MIDHLRQIRQKYTGHSCLLTFLPCLNQMGAVETSFDEIPNLFDTGGAKGLPCDSVEKIPKITITSKNNIDGSGEEVSCSVCLQVRPMISHLAI